MRNRIVLFILIALLSLGCASKRYAKKAKELEKAGLFIDAADMYYNSAKANKNNVDAKIGLRKNGQLALDKKLSQFETDYTNRNVKEAVYSYIDAVAYQNKIKSVGVELDIPTTAQQYYKEIKEEYLDNRYNEGTSALDREDYTLANSIFTEINNIDSNFRDVNTQLVIARYEPIYLKAIDELNNGKFRAAYYDFYNVLKGANGSYKEADILKKEAQDKAMITIAVMPFDAPRFTQAETASFSSKIISNIKKYNSPFIDFKDYSVAGSINNLYVGVGLDIKAARAAGIKAILVGRVNNYSEEEGQIRVAQKKAYIRHERKYKDKEGKEQVEITYEKDKYIEYTNSNSVYLAIEYKLISTETGEVMSADSYNKQSGDQIRYAKYSGSYKSLVPGYWVSLKNNSKEDKVYDDDSSIRKLRSLFTSRQVLVSTNKQSNDLEEAVANDIAKNIIKYNPEK